MKAICLCAGYGTRLGELTKNKPKPVIKIGGKAVIEHIIDNLEAHGIEDIIINVHYLPQMIVKLIQNRALYYYESRLLGHSGTIKSLKDWLKGEDFFVLNGDTISNVNFHDMMSKYKEGHIVALMDNWRCAGCWYYPNGEYDYDQLPVIPYRPKDLVWHDIGTLDRLKEAKEYYEKT